MALLGLSQLGLQEENEEMGRELAQGKVHGLEQQVALQQAGSTCAVLMLVSSCHACVASTAPTAALTGQDRLLVLPL